MKSVSNVLTVVALALVVTACATAPQGTSRDAFDEDWRSEWEVVMNLSEPPKPGEHAMGWLRGNLPPEGYINRPHFEGDAKRMGLLAMHPTEARVPSGVRYKGTVPSDSPIMSVEVSGHVNGDFLLLCLANLDDVGEHIVDGTKWHTIKFDLSEHVGKEIDLQLWNVAGGEHEWSYEHCYIDAIYFTSAPE